MFNETVYETISMISGHLTHEDEAITLCQNVKQTSSDRPQYPSFLYIQSGPKKCIHSLLINIFGINLNEISISV